MGLFKVGSSGGLGSNVDRLGALGRALLVACACSAVGFCGREAKDERGRAEATGNSRDGTRCAATGEEWAAIISAAVGRCRGGAPLLLCCTCPCLGRKGLAGCRTGVDFTGIWEDVSFADPSEL